MDLRAVPVKNIWERWDAFSFRPTTNWQKICILGRLWISFITGRQTSKTLSFKSGLVVCVVFIDRYLESLMERQCTLVSDIMRTLKVCQFLLGIIKPELGDFAKLPGFYGSFCLCLVKIETPLDIVFSKFLDPGYPWLYSLINFLM